MCSRCRAVQFPRFHVNVLYLLHALLHHQQSTISSCHLQNISVSARVFHVSLRFGRSRQCGLAAPAAIWSTQRGMARDHRARAAYWSIRASTVLFTAIWGNSCQPVGQYDLDPGIVRDTGTAFVDYWVRSLRQALMILILCTG